MERKTVAIYMNKMPVRWTPYDYYSAVAASERTMCALGRELVKRGFTVEIYADITKDEIVWEGVTFRQREAFPSWQDYDALIVFKDKEIYQQSLGAKKIFHYTAEIDYGFTLPEYVEKYIAISPYHEQRSLQESPDIKGRTTIIPCGVDDLRFSDLKTYSAIYSSAPERGLSALLENYTKDMPKLSVAYGWESYELYNSWNQSAMLWRNEMIDKLDKIGSASIKYSRSSLDELYINAKYWMFPLTRADSELLCTSAIEAQLAGCIPVINRLGALQTTVLNAIDFKDWNGRNSLTKEQLEQNRKHAEQFLWDNVINLWLNIL